MKKTRWIFLLVFVLLTMLLAATIPAAAEAEEPSADELYQEQLEASGAQEIWDKLPGGDAAAAGQSGDYRTRQGQPVRPDASSLLKRPARSFG